MPRQRTPSRFLGWIELSAGGLLALSLILLQVRMVLHAGGLWRDEATSVQLAELPSIADTVNLLEFDSFPILWNLVLRGWLALGFGATDFGLRVLGLLVVIGIVAALWWCARCFAAEESRTKADPTPGSASDSRIFAIPLLSLVLAGSCPYLYQVGGSLRAYGCGILLLLLALGSLWRMIQYPTTGRIVLAVLAAVLCVQTLYYNAVLLLAISLSAVVVCLKRSQWGRAGLVIGVGAVAAVSLLPYAGVIQRVHDFSMLVQSQSVEPMGLAESFVAATDPDNSGVRWIWLATAVATAVAFFLRILVQSREPWGQPQDRLLFTGTAAVLAIVFQFGFLWRLSYITSGAGWYYLTLLVLIPVLLDVGIQVQAERHKVWRWLRLVLILGTLPLAWKSIRTVTEMRLTNIDLIAQRIRQDAAPEDLVIVNPWWMGISFQRYYNGPAAWKTLPDIPDHRVHRYDLFKAKMTEIEPNAALLAQVDQTLRTGHRVWTVGPTYFANPNAQLQPLPPAPHSPTGWQEEPYQRYWRVQLAQVLQKPGFRYEKRQIDSSGPVLRHENTDLNVWQRPK